MNGQDKESVSYIAFEAEMVRQERTVRRLWITALLTLAALVATNAAWVLYFFG